VTGTVEFDQETTEAVDALRVSLSSYGYEVIPEHTWLRPGVRLHHVGEKYPEAYRDGTAVIAVVLKHRAGEDDFEVIVVKDDDSHWGRRVSQWANYHCAQISAW
jgi:hypothetical protein